MKEQAKTERRVDVGAFGLGETARRDQAAHTTASWDQQNHLARRREGGVREGEDRGIEEQGQIIEVIFTPNDATDSDNTRATAASDLPFFSLSLSLPLFVFLYSILSFSFLFLSRPIWLYFDFSSFLSFFLSCLSSY